MIPKEIKNQQFIAAQETDGAQGEQRWQAETRVALWEIAYQIAVMNNNSVQMDESEIPDCFKPQCPRCESTDRNKQNFVDIGGSHELTEPCTHPWHRS